MYDGCILGVGLSSGGYNLGYKYSFSAYNILFQNLRQDESNP